ncbi:MAG: ATP-binding protein [Wenzhouxiangella sp.]
MQRSIPAWSLCFALLGGLWISVAHAAIDFHPVFRSLDTPGLPDQHVEAIVQDRHGYVWIGTRGGLVRHDGREISFLPRDPRHPNALPDVNIMSLYAHSSGTVWAGVSGEGAVEIGPDLIPRRHLAPQSSGGPLPAGHVWSIAEDCEGRVWLAFMRGGLARYDPRSGDLLLIPQEERLGLDPTAFQTALLVDSECRLWLAQASRVVVMETSGDEYSFIQVATGAPSPAEIFLALHEHSQLGVLAGQGRQVLRLKENDQAPGGFEPERLFELTGLVSGISELPDARLVVASQAGPYFIDPFSGQTQRLAARPDLPDALPDSGSVGTPLVDREGGVWLAITRRGLVYLPPDHAMFSRLERGFRVDEPFVLERISAVRPGLVEHSFWVGGRGGIQRVNLNTGDIEHASELFASFPPELNTQAAGFLDLLERPEGLLLLDLRTVGLLSREKGGFEYLFQHTQLNHTSLTFFFPDGEQGLWVGTTTEGLLRLDLSTREFTRYAPDQASPRYLSAEVAQFMTRDPAGNLLLAADNAIYKHSADQGFIRLATVDHGRITDLSFAPDGTMWVAGSASLSRWRLATDSAEFVRAYDIHSLVERAALRQVFQPSEEEVWLVLSNGVARLNPITGQSRLFTRSDGLPAGEFANRASVLAPDGRILIGGTLGLVLMNLDQPRREPIAPLVHLTRVLAGDLDQLLVPGFRPRLDLDWRQNSVRFEFSARTFAAPERVRFRVLLEGWDDDWIELRDQGQMYYSNLRPGTYRFRVQVATADGIWNNADDSIVLDLAPPPWASPAAYISYAAILTGGLAIGWSNARRARRRRLYLQEVQQKRSIAEAQRQLLQRLNDNLEPMPLAHAISQEIQRLTGAASACFAYVHEQMPRDLIETPQPLGLKRTQWRQQINAVDGISSQAVDLQADREIVASVLLQAPPEGFQVDHEEQLALLVDLAGQALHNSLLLQRVKRLADRAEAANQAKSEFLATMSHEIRTPLHGVMGMADLLHERETEADRLELISTLRASGRQLQRVIDDVLDVSQIEAGRLSIKQETFELMSMLEHVVDLHAANAARKQLDLRLSVQSDLPLAIRGDADRLSQILGNLLSNAVKFTERGAIELAVLRDRQGLLRFVVRDSGPGIDPKHRCRLFQAFTQLDASIRRLHGGSGLGLAICRSLAEGMGGNLELMDRRWPGSTFRLTLPCDAPAAPRPLTRLLENVNLVALVDPASYRVLLRCSRRWGFKLHNGWRVPLASGAVVLVDARLLAAQAGIEAWLEASDCVLMLDPPLERDEYPPPVNGSGQRLLRWPLQEGRLVAALMDVVLEAVDKRADCSDGRLCPAGAKR